MSYNPFTPGQTPYQGPDRVYGKFKCPYCNREWTSDYSWANKGQKCEDCNDRFVYPHEQTPKRSTEEEVQKKKSKTKDYDQSKPSKYHDDHKCEKCRYTGRSCAGRQTHYK